MNSYLIIIGIVLFIFIIYGYSSNYSCKVTRKDIFLKKRESSFSEITFAVISDLHGHSFGKRNKKLIEKVHKNKPDVIVVPGDMLIKNGKGKEVCFDLLKQLTGRYPVFYAPGNHELRLADQEDFEQRVRALGVCYLTNEAAEFQSPKGSIKVYGLALPEESYQKVWKKTTLRKNQMTEDLGKPNPKKINVLLAHTPEYAEQYSKWGADIVFSGHMHGGILSFWFGGVISPSLRLFPKYSKGYYQVGQTHLYVSRGLGLHHIKLRFFNLPELAFVTLKSGSGRQKGSDLF